MTEPLDIGPLEPVDGLLTLTENQFENRYGPETDENGDLYRQREWYEPEDKVELEKAVAENRCWTAIDDDNGHWCLVWGNRVVNRLYNIITERPIEDPDWEIQVPDDHVYDDEPEDDE